MTVTTPTRDVIDSNLANLRRIPFFSGLPEEILSAIAGKLRREHYVKDDVVFVQGGLGNAMYLIESGQVVVVVQSGPEEQNLAYLGDGSFVGVMALLLGKLRSSTVRVLIDAELLVLQKSDLDDLLMQYPSIALTFSRSGRRLSFTDHRPVVVKANNIVGVCGGSVDKLAESLTCQTGNRALIISLEGAAYTPGINGALNPVPTNVLAERGADLIIASSVIPSLEDRLQRKAMKREGRVPNIFGVLLGVMEVMESEIIKIGMNLANVVIRPAVENISAEEFERAPELIQLGEDAANRALDQIQQLFLPLPRERAR